jgi:hypothetical protein
MFMQLKIFGINWFNLDIYAFEYVWMVMPKTLNGITIQLNGDAEDSQRHNHSP